MIKMMMMMMMMMVMIMMVMIIVMIIVMIMVMMMRRPMAAFALVDAVTRAQASRMLESVSHIAASPALLLEYAVVAVFVAFNFPLIYSSSLQSTKALLASSGDCHTIFAAAAAAAAQC
jgi:hypothetical protein